MSESPKLKRVREGWAAVGDGWAVFGPTREDALARYQEAERLHAEIEARPSPEPALQSTA